MALYPSTRISLKFNDIDNYQCWFLVDHQKMPCVNHLQQQINSRFYNNVKGKIILTLKGSLIPPWESSLILRDDDQIVVQKEDGNTEVKCFAKKKGKKKLNTSLKNDSVIEIDTKANDIIFISENKGNLLDNSKKEYSTKKKDKTKKRKYLDVKEKQEEEYLEETEKIEELSEKREKKKKKECAKKKEKVKAHLREKEKEHVEKKEHTMKRRRKEIEVYEEESPLLSVESKKKKKRKSEACDYVPVVKLDFENSPEELVERDQKRHGKKIQKLHELCKNQSTDCDQHKEIVIDDDDDEEEEEGAEEYNNNIKGNNSDLNKEIIIDDDDEEEEEDKPNISSDNRDLENNNIKITPVVSLSEIPDNQATLQNSDLCEKPKSSQKEEISLSTISPISTTHTKKNSDIIVNSSKKNIPVKEAVEVFGISNENLTAICKAVEKGESLTLSGSKVKRIELCPSVNENVFNMNNIVRNEKLLINKITEKNGSKPHRRRPRKRRHGPSFACAPFIQAMSSHSEGDASSLNSTPKTYVPQHSNSVYSSRNNSDKHIHFDSEDEAEETASNITSACDELEPSHSTPIPVDSLQKDNHKIQLPNVENSLVSETSEPQSNVDNWSTFSVRNALRKNPGVYQRGVGLVKSFEMSSSTAIIQQDKQLQNKNQAQLSSSVSKPNYDGFPPLTGIPRVDDRIAFKRLEIGLDYSPVISDYREATVLAFEDETKMITLKFHTSRELKRTDGKFELCFEVEEVKNTENEPDNDMETVLFSTLMDVKLLSKS
ncbi:chromatin-remodeling ATPase INO80 isoform X1 [Octopus sinensis]|uniref:Chromatin-remodeling ATPase INO80 isoform X1 n=1 Tax=Octopus sinensis TaxID=2607531 RepID=A0A6P7SFK5_9MOLL|nr:chromatin-remodeling ATPase INO80 isoform X1 [Octopus sinensis]